MSAQNKRKRKHHARRCRRENYHGMLDAELEAEHVFQRRVIRAIDRGGLDIAPDGRPIKADYWRYMQDRDGDPGQAAQACLYHVERAVGSLRPRPPAPRGEARTSSRQPDA